VAEGQGCASQQQPVQAEILPEKAVLATIAAQHVADERVPDVGEVAADLMGAAGSGVDPEEAVAGGGVGADRAGNLRRGQAREFGLGFLQGAGFGFERVVDESLVRGEAPRHGKIGLATSWLRELEGQAWAACGERAMIIRPDVGRSRRCTG
jgi:hypothetical protein